MPKEAVNLFYDVKNTGSKFLQKNKRNKKIHPYLTQVGGQQTQVEHIPLLICYTLYGMQL